MKDADVFTKLKFPLVVSPKLDGIRSIVRGGRVVSRKLLDLPRHHVQSAFHGFEHLDGEMIVGSPSAPDCYNRTQSYVMSKDERPVEPLTFYVFDWADPDSAHMPFSWRLDAAREAIEEWRKQFPVDDVKIVPHKFVNSLDEFLEFEAECLAQGFEGIMARRPDGPYKHGRSTFNEHTLMKLKRFEDVECEVAGFIEQETNTNEAEKDELGHTKRSSAKDGMVGAGTLGKFIVIYQGKVLDIPCGTLNHAQRQVIWNDQDRFKGKIIKVRHFPHGAKDLLRLPRCVGFRDPIDL